MEQWNMLSVRNFVREMRTSSRTVFGNIASEYLATVTSHPYLGILLVKSFV